MHRATGKAGRFFHALTTVVCVAAAGGPAVADGPSVPRVHASRASALHDMTRSMRRAYLVSIRKELVSRGYLPSHMGPLSAADIVSAIRRYQVDARLPADGVASRELLDHMWFVNPVRGDDRPALARSRPEAAAPAPRDEPGEGATGAEPVPSPEAEPPSAPATPLPAIPSEEVKREPLPLPAPPAGPGAEPAARSSPVPLTRPAEPAMRPVLSPPAPAASSDGDGFVSRIQRELRARGHYDGPIDGVYGQATARAVRRFQKERSLPSTGVIDAPLLNALSIG